MLWRAGNREFDLSREGLIMGILNVTPDSFSDGGLHFDPVHAVARGLEMAADGAAIIDVGGESTRPGAEPVSEAEELRRVIPVIAQLAPACGCAVSIDTSKAAVAEAAIAAGAVIINDVTGLRGDLRMRAVVRSTGAGLVLMHMTGTPRTMQDQPAYADVVREVGQFLGQQLLECLNFGIDPDCIALDPGIGFGKTVEHNLTLLKNLRDLATAGRPLVVGASRKSFIGKLLGSDRIDDRLWPTVAITSCAREQGARVFRVHDVRPNLQALRMTEAILDAGHD